MFKKTIAVLLMLSIVLSSCGKKDKSNDFTRVTPTTPTPPPATIPPAPTLKSISESIDALLDVQLYSCSEPPAACRKAQDEDPQRLNTDLWRACLSSKVSCPEAWKLFLKAWADYFASLAGLQ